MENKLGADSTQECRAENSTSELPPSNLMAWFSKQNTITLSDFQKKKKYLEIEGTQFLRSPLRTRSLCEIPNSKRLLSLNSYGSSPNEFAPKFTLLEMIDISIKEKPKRVSSYLLPDEGGL